MPCTPSAWGNHYKSIFSKHWWLVSWALVASSAAHTQNALTSKGFWCTCSTNITQTPSFKSVAYIGPFQLLTQPQPRRGWRFFVIVTGYCALTLPSQWAGHGGKHTLCVETKAVQTNQVLSNIRSSITVRVVHLFFTTLLLVFSHVCHSVDFFLYLYTHTRTT